MNLALVDPFDLAQDLPNALERSMRHGHAHIIRFSHRGDYLASGRSDGKVLIYDWETYSVARKLKAHATQVDSVSWSSDDRYLLSSGFDNRVVLWDLMTGDEIREVRFNSPCLIAELDPLNHLRFVVSLASDDARIVDATNPDDDPTIMVLTSVPKQLQQLQNSANADSDATTTTTKRARKPIVHSSTVSGFTPTGELIVSGTSYGWLNFHAADTGVLLASIKVCEGMLRAIKFTRNNAYMCIFGGDRTVKLYDLPTQFSLRAGFDFATLNLHLAGKYTESVNYDALNYATISNTGEYVIITRNGSISQSTAVYVHGPMGLTIQRPLDVLDLVACLEWHPHKACLVAVGLTDGRLYVYSCIPSQKWSALAPDFVAVEENIEYIERETEFDIEHDEKLHQRRLDREEEVDVDVLTMDPPRPGQWQRGDFFIPVLTEDMDAAASDSDDDIVAVGRGQYARKSTRLWADDESETGTPSVVSNGNGSGGGGSASASKRKRYLDP